MILKKIAQLIPFISAALFVLTPIFQVLSQSNSFTYNGTIIYTTVEDSVFYASIGLAITFILILLKQNAWKYLFLGLILLSFTHIIQFSNWSFSMGIGDLSINLLTWGLLISHLALNPSLISFFFSNKTENDTKPNEITTLPTKETEHKITFFERKFASKTKHELTLIIEQKERVPEAIEAARRILARR